MNIFLTSIQSIIPIIAIIVLGYILQVRGWFGEDFGPNLSRLIMNVALPVSIFVSVLKYLTLSKLISLSSSLVWVLVAFVIEYLCQCQYNLYRASFECCSLWRRGTSIFLGLLYCEYHFDMDNRGLSHDNR